MVEAGRTERAMGDKTTPFCVRLSDDRMNVLFDGVVSDEGFDSLLARIMAELEKLGVRANVSPEAVAARLRFAAESGPQVEGASLLEGHPPVPPQDGSVQWASDFFGGGFAVDEESGAIDYRKKLAQPQVSKDDLLAEVLPAVPGKDGLDVFGKLVHVEKARAARIRAGANVYTNDDNTRFYASTAGRVRFSNDVLSVDVVYTIPGNVDLATGNIYHPGALVIEGDVQANSKITADGDIDVKGLVEASDIQCGGNLVVRGGITGGAGHRITVAGTIHARFILENDVRAGGDIFAEREIIHSKVYTCGCVNVPGGRLVGSEITALSGIVVRQAGSEAVVPTLLTVAGTAQANAEITLRERLIAQYQEDIARIDVAIKPVARDMEALSPRKREALTELMARKGEMNEVAQSLRGEIDHIKEISGEKPHADIVVRETLYPETTLCIRDVKVRITEPIRGPLRARLLRGKIQITSVLKDE